jgi:hypothetical protein
MRLRFIAEKGREKGKLGITREKSQDAASKMGFATSYC